MGGTIKKYTENGVHVKILIMATGILARRSLNFTNSTEYKISKYSEKKINLQIKQLQKQAYAAAKVVGVDDIEFFNFPDNEMDLVSNLEITKKIENVILKFKPSIVYTHSNADINIDHRSIYNATITATRPGKNSVEKVISFEVPSSTEWNFPSTFSPNIFIDISSELSFKLKSMSKYKDELNEFPHPRSLKGLEIIAKRWGTVSGYNAAEAFCLVRELKGTIEK
jgi:LmbE family N-acetylglucosaminyl deacetylase